MPDSVLKRTGVTEGFYRSWQHGDHPPHPQQQQQQQQPPSGGGGSASAPTSGNAPVAPQSSAMLDRMTEDEDGNDFNFEDVPNLAFQRSTPPRYQQPPQQQQQQSPAGTSAPDLPEPRPVVRRSPASAPLHHHGSGNLMAPGDLGRTDSDSPGTTKKVVDWGGGGKSRSRSDDVLYTGGRGSGGGSRPSSPQPRVVAHPATLFAHKRAMQAIYKSQRHQQAELIAHKSSTATADSGSEDGGDGRIAGGEGVDGGDADSGTKNRPSTPFAREAGSRRSLDRSPSPRRFSCKNHNLSKVTAFTYRGMEVMFGTTPRACYGMCSRTRHVFQTLDYAPGAGPVASVASDPTTGAVAIAHRDGTIRTYHPAPVDLSACSFGRYRWRNGPAVLKSGREVFRDCSDASGAAAGDIGMSLSFEHKLLVAQGSQLAVFDIFPPAVKTRAGISATAAKKVEDEQEAELLWTTRLPAPVVTAVISGDGESIAVVLQRRHQQGQLQQAVEEEKDTAGSDGAVDDDDDDDDGADGVHTFERDHEDGSDNGVAIGTIDQGSEQQESDDVRPLSVTRSRSVGILYKPGPFLVHSDAVVRLAFRGLGHATSNVQHLNEQGNDLLLTYGEDHVARVFAQNHWRPLTEWTTPPRTRVDWVRGVAAFTLGDLETQKKPKAGGGGSRGNSAPSSRRPSLNGYVNEADAINETLGKRHHYNSFPASTTTPTCNAGAWISEVTFEGRSPAIRLSRLTYLKRGMDDLNPTLFENVSSYLPPGFLMEDAILLDAAVFSVEGIWPAWNPWLSETIETDITETLRGSAMAFLGLSSGPGGVGAAGSGSHFGNSLLGNTQSPPSEVRLLAAHPSSGKLVALEFPLLGDPDWTALELGNPRKSILMLSDLDETVTTVNNASDSAQVAPAENKLQDIAAMDYESSRLVARVRQKSSRVSIAWQKRGSLNLLPSIWAPADVEPSRAVKALSEQCCFKDDSVMPVPLALPSVGLPPNDLESETIVSLAWWSDEHFGAPPLLVALTSTGSVVVFELPPPWSSHEAVTFRNDASSPDAPHGGSVEVHGANEQMELTYDVLIAPDPDYGLGLRLEVQRDGMPAVAGSFKRHPLSGETLPAEKTGMVNLGDELVSANGVSLENKLFDDIIATVRDLGAACGPGHPMRLKFRHRPPPPPSVHVSGLDSPGRRSMEEILGLKSIQSTFTDQADDSPGRSSPRMGKRISSPVDMGFVVGVFEEVFPERPRDISSGFQKFSLLPCKSSSVENKGRHHFEKSAVLFLVTDTRVSSILIKLDLSEKGEPGRSYDLSSWNLPTRTRSEDSSSYQIVAADVTKTDVASFAVVFSDSAGNISVLVSTLVSNDSSQQGLVPSMTYRHFDICCTQDMMKDKLVLRTCSVELIGTMHTKMDGSAGAIHIWSSSPYPVCTGTNVRAKSDAEGDTTVLPEYSAACILADSGDAFLDFAFIDSGFLDSSRPLLVFSRKRAILFSRPQGSPDWSQCVQISYNPIPGSSLGSPCSDSLTEVIAVGRKGIQTVFPHLVQAMMLAYASKDERDFLRSDWHPESLLSYIFADERGPKTVLKDRVRCLFQWLCSEGSDIPEDHLEAPLVIAPLPILTNSSDSDEGSSVAGPDDGLSSMVSSESEEKVMFRKLLSVLISHCSGGVAESSVATNTTATAASTATPGLTVSLETELDLPPVVESMLPEDVHILRACCALLLDPPDFKSIDHVGQNLLACVSLLSKLQSLKGKGTSTPRSSHAGFAAPQVLIKTRSYMTEDSTLLGQTPAISSCGSLAGLLSNSQARLIECCRPPDRKLDWSLGRQLRIPFWVRSDVALARLSEEIGQTIFREKRDLMECALFFIIARKTKTLRNLAAANQTETGKKFFKFLTSYDFSSERGRRAAEKNAFSLLRKCQYRAASAFFLLAQPPSLNSALETIVTKMRDTDLAFLVARLVESRELESPSSGIAGGIASFGTGAIGLSGFGTGGILGGGGGYAGSGGNEDTSRIGIEESDFQEWKPKLGPAAQKLLVKRILPLTYEDPGLTAMQLIWMGKREEAAWCLSGIIRVNGIYFTPSTSEEVAHRFFSNKTRLSDGDAVTQATEKANCIVNFVSAPNLLKAMRSCPRARFASALVVANALNAKGIELSAIQTVLQYAKPFDQEEKVNAACAPKASTGASPPDQGGSAGATESSIFDSFDVAGPNSKAAASATDQSSSIFDSYDAPAIPQSSAALASGQPQSSIFEDFDVPKPVTKAPPLATAPSGGMQSSIFDDFEAPAEVKKAGAATTPSGGMQSSIFDDFEAPQIKKAPAATTPSGGMQSSIFDDFDASPQVKKTQAEGTTTTSSDQTQSSSIFDSYDVPSHGLTTTATATASSSSGAALALAPSSGDAHVSSVVNEEPVEIGFDVEPTPTPKLWFEWRENILVRAAARRLLREVASVLTDFHGDPLEPSISDFYQRDDPLVPSGASGILQLPCDAEQILGRVRNSLAELCSSSGIERDSVTQSALQLLGLEHQPHRTLFAVVLHAATGRVELAEGTLRAAAFDVMQLCQSFAFSYDNLVHKRKTRSHVATQFLRRRAARASWQLETCLWLHRGGGLPLSGVALKEAIVAVRVGLLVASWNHNHECLEVMIRSDPDCHLDDEVARHLWTSLKMITPPADQHETKKTSSGGWEFLVDCRRTEATHMLRDKRTGCFIIRPHSGDHGIFTLSFKTNLVPTPEDNSRRPDEQTPDTSADELSESDVVSRQSKAQTKPVRKDDVVQHAIIRLSDSGYRCGSFGPYTSLISLLEAVSDSLPFNLRFDLPPSNRVIKEEGSQPSPNAVFLRKLALAHADSMVSNPPSHDDSPRRYMPDRTGSYFREKNGGHADSVLERQTSFGLFLELLVLSAARMQLGRVAVAEYDDLPSAGSGSEDDMIEYVSDGSSSAGGNDVNNINDGVGGNRSLGDLQDRVAGAYRMLSPLSEWCRSLEILAADVLAPELSRLIRGTMDTARPVDLAESAGAIEAAPPMGVCSIDGGDALLRRMIQRDSGVEFSTLRLVDGGECTIVVIFSQNDAVRWLVSSGMEENEEEAIARLESIDRRRVIESIDLSGLKLKQKEVGLEREGTRYRILDPWEVEALQNWEGETLGASVGRERYLGFNLGKVGLASESIFRSIGGLPLLSLWTSTKGGVVLTKALATVHPPWERAIGGDLQSTNGTVSEPPPFENSIRQHLYRNALFRRLSMPQRFMSLIQVELLDLKNLTAPGGSLSMSVYALLRLKREGSTAALTNKARTLDTAATNPVKLGKTSGPNAPASWGSVVRFRFPLPEKATVDGVSYDSDRELLFKGPPCVLQVSVYEKKLLVDYSLGTADIRTDGLWAGGQLEEWVPLRSEKHGISWFARIRLTLRFELMCLATDDGYGGEDGSGGGNKDLAVAAPSVGLRKIKQLCQAGGSAHEDVKRSVSSPDLLTYFESMVY